MIEIEVIGQKEARAKFKALKLAIGPALKISVQGGAYVVRNAAIANVPRETSSLARSIHVEIKQVSNTYARAIVGTDLEYAAQVEFGGTITAKNAPYLVFKTRDGIWHRVKSVTQVPQPYLRPALDENVVEVIAVIRDVFKRILEAV